MSKKFALIWAFFFTSQVCGFSFQDFDQNDYGSFWHLSDFHFDKNYSHAGDVNNMCHEINQSSGSVDIGLYGNILCDSPEQLVDLTIKFMKSQVPAPDFIIWTGDNLPHTRHPSPDWGEVLDEIKKLTNKLKNAFPNVQIYPTIGNHDTSPPNFLDPTGGIQEYKDYLELGAWNTILPESTWDTFKMGGYYSHSRNGSRIINLNTMLWYFTNTWVKDRTNVDQIKFLKTELESASKAKEVVYILGHVSPGFYNRNYHNQMSDPLYHLQYLKEYLQIIKTYADVIKGQFFGHIHNDMFQLYYCDTGKAYSSGLLASSVTPWYSTKHSNINVSIPVNPSVRLMHYNRNNLLLLNYDQYFLNLTEANERAKMEQEPQFELLYQFNETYGVSDLSTNSLVSVYENLKTNQTLFKIFFKYLTAGIETVDCNKGCQTAQLCSMGATSHDEYLQCMHSSGDNQNNHHVATYVIVSICILIVIFGVGLYYYKKKLRHSHRDFNNIYAEF